jgi:hypothetical protein
MSRVYSISTVMAALNKKNPPDLVIVATGEVPSTGWSDVVLSPYIYITPPADGIWDFDFIGKPPTGIVNSVILPVSASFEVADVDLASFWGPGQPLTGVRIHARANSLDAQIGSSLDTIKAL